MQPHRLLRRGAASLGQSGKTKLGGWRGLSIGKGKKPLTANLLRLVKKPEGTKTAGRHEELEEKGGEAKTGTRFVPA